MQAAIASSSHRSCTVQRQKIVPILSMPQKRVLVRVNREESCHNRARRPVHPSMCSAKTANDSCLLSRASPSAHPLHCTNPSARALFLISTILRLLHSQSTLTKRDVYYQNPTLFNSSQSNADSMLHAMAQALQVSRRHLHILAKPKGLLCGDVRLFTLVHNAQRMVQLSPLQMHTIHPNIDSYAHIDVSSIQFVLCVEKEAIFSRLVHFQFASMHSCLLMTGKGYPDVASRLFLARIAKENPKLPIFCLVDGDPFGIDIFLAYKCGTESMKAQNHELVVPRLVWIGLDIQRDYAKYNIPPESLLPLSQHEVKKAKKVLKRLNHGSYAKERSSLQHMLQEQHKAEIEALSTLGYQFLAQTYLPERISEELGKIFAQEELNGMEQ